MFPPEAEAELVAATDEVLETYKRPSGPAQPEVHKDEQPVQLAR